MRMVINAIVAWTVLIASGTVGGRNGGIPQPQGLLEEEMVGFHSEMDQRRR